MGRAMANEVVCVGNIVVDAVGVYVDRIPEEGALALFDRVEMHLGGCANNMSIALAKLGVPVTLAAKVGTDGLGDFCVKTLSGHGVDTHALVRSATDSTSFSFIMIPRNGNRRILHTLAANATFEPADLPAGLFDGARWVSFNGLAIIPRMEGEALAGLLRAARAAGCGAKPQGDTAINDRYTPAEWERMLAPCYPLFDVLFPSEVEAVALTGSRDPRTICATLRRRGVRIAGVKLGERGCAVESDEGYFEIPAYTVNCVDTLGAGDAFMAGLVAGLLRGLKPSEAARLGNAVSGNT